jgi:hypothetical protein
MKTTINKKLPIAILVLAWALVGCQSEVDKCVNAYVKEFGKTEEATARLMCLKAQSGK